MLSGHLTSEPKYFQRRLITYSVPYMRTMYSIPCKSSLERTFRECLSDSLYMHKLAF